MNNRNYLKDVYEDFFGIEKIKKENEALRNELDISDEYPTIEVKPVSKVHIEKSETKEQKDEHMRMLFEKIESLWITEESKITLKKMAEYARKYQEKLEKQFIPFHMCIYSDDQENSKRIVDVIKDTVQYFSYIPKGNMIQKSFYQLEKVEEIDSIYGKENSIIVFKDLEGWNTQEQNFKDKLLHRLEEKLKESSQYLTILVSKNKDTIVQFFEKNDDIKEQLFEFEIIEKKPDCQDAYQAVLEKLKENEQISEEFSVKLLDYITDTYPKTAFSFSEYRDKLCSKILFHKKDKLSVEDIPELEKEKTMDEIFEELNSLVGLSKVKKTLQDLVSLMELKSKTKNELKIKNTNLHMLFLGNPGTGKTTVARIVAQILYHLGYIKQNKLIEVSSKDLVAEYVGQTAPKTMAVIEKAMGGVLFIDEAYSLASGNGQGNSYNEEAIATLIQAMENHRDDFVVIFAGYTKEMQSFLDSNSGIVSRIGYTMEFEDYTEQELLQIFTQMITKAGFKITKKASDKALEIIREFIHSKNFGNARFARNLYEKTIIQHAANTKGKNDKKALKTIQEEDISVENILK